MNDFFSQEEREAIQHMSLREQWQVYEWLILPYWLFDEENGRTAWATTAIRLATIIVCAIVLLRTR